MLLLEPGQNPWFYVLTMLTVKLTVSTNENAAHR